MIKQVRFLSPRQMKKCIVCLRRRRNANFYLRDNGKLSNRCKQCQLSYGREHYEANKARHNERRAVRRDSEKEVIKALVVERKSVPCVDCTESFPSWAMDFDHVRGVKKFNLGCATRYSLQQVLEEIDKCDVVCAICHRYRTHGVARFGVVS